MLSAPARGRLYLERIRRRRPLPPALMRRRCPHACKPGLRTTFSFRRFRWCIGPKSVRTFRINPMHKQKARAQLRVQRSVQRSRKLHPSPGAQEGPSFLLKETLKAGCRQAAPYAQDHKKRAGRRVILQHLKDAREYQRLCHSGSRFDVI